MAQPLPQLDNLDISTEPILHAYDLCLNLESHASNNTSLPHVGHLAPVVCARLLGRMLLEAPTDEGRMNMASEINRTKDEVSLQELADIYKNHLLRCCELSPMLPPVHVLTRDPAGVYSVYRIKCQTPPGSHPSESDLKKREVSASLALTPSSHKIVKCRALRRDGSKCMLSKALDFETVEANPSLYDGESIVQPTHCAHIFDRFTNENLDDVAKNHYAASIHAIMDIFGGIESIEELNGSKVHRLENVLTLITPLHEYFARLKIWLEEDPTLHTGSTKQLHHEDAAQVSIYSFADSKHASSLHDRRPGELSST
ncbi:hypothetical protein EVG20_g3981 [Dentipellis fragilis]|uniref:HNH nuclease domain-containing protein n=1 Tax=Dentipellis fragilis TaxID=205917 RepID=A0A4Y9YZY7_9AGAM|nr:hypothetical protein EVG20_g3981 [Dentipellis fragilis]